MALQPLGLHSASQKAGLPLLMTVVRLCSTIVTCRLCIQLASFETEFLQGATWYIQIRLGVMCS